MILLIIPKINVAYFSKFSSQYQNGVYMILSILSSMFKHFWRRQYMYFYQVDIFEILPFNQNIIFLFCCIFQEFSRLLKAIDWETRNTIQNRLYYLELWSSTNYGVTIGCQCRSELMVLWWNCWTQIHGPYGQSIEHEDRDKLCCLLYTGNIKNNYLKKLFLLHTHHNMNKSCQYCQLICLLFVFKMNLWICQCYFCLLVTSILKWYLPTSM